MDRGDCRGDFPWGDAKELAVLGYGQSIPIENRIRCTSRRNGLTCRGRKGAGAGFTVSREDYRIYR